MYWDEQKAWLEALKVGDKVAVVGCDKTNAPVIGTVDRMTKTQFVVLTEGENVQLRFFRDNGRMTTVHAKKDWEYEIYSPEGARVAGLRARLARQNWWHLPVVLLEHINRLLDENTTEGTKQ